MDEDQVQLLLKSRISKGLWDLRMKEGYSRQDFSDFADISLNSYSKIENGQSLIKIDNLMRLLSSLSISLNEFFDEIEV